VVPDCLPGSSRVVPGLHTGDFRVGWFSGTGAGWFWGWFPPFFGSSRARYNDDPSIDMDTRRAAKSSFQVLEERGEQAGRARPDADGAVTEAGELDERGLGQPVGDHL
jgi:hypothetical protein